MGKGTEHGCLLLSEAEGCSCCFLPCGSRIAPNSPFIYAWCRETMQGSKVWSGRRGKTPVLLVWLYVVCHPCLVAQVDALPGIIPLLFPSRRPVSPLGGVSLRSYTLYDLSPVEQRDHILGDTALPLLFLAVRKHRLLIQTVSTHHQLEHRWL